MNILNFFKGRTPKSSDISKDLWDESLESIPYGEQIRYKIALKLSTIKSGERFGIEDVFGDSCSTDEYIEFIKFLRCYSGPDVFQSQDEFESAIADNPQDSNTQKKIANTYIAIGQPEKSTEWYKKAALDGDAEALTRYAGALFYGVNTPIDIIQSNELCKKAIVTDGFPDALLDLALRYIHGQGVPVNINHAFRLMERSAKQGNMAAQNNLGFMYRNGQGVNTDNEKALYWYHQSANQGYEGAIMFLCNYYQQNDNIPELVKMLHIGAHFNIQPCLDALNNMGI